MGAGLSFPPEVRMDTWFGLLAPPSTSDAVVARLARESDSVVHQGDLRQKLFRIGCEVAWMPPAHMHDKFAFAK
jgi:tripartite-type tricarboxylate transporter receptor subunit TctC